jgi:hypothetical protein
MVLKLYGTGQSTCTRRVATVLHEKNIAFELVVVDLMKGEHKSPEYLKKQPFGQVPYIVRILRCEAIRPAFIQHSLRMTMASSSTKVALSADT